MTKSKLLVFSLFAYFHSTICTWEIQRRSSSLGDTLYGDNLNCTKYNAYSFPATNHTCYCGRKTFFTDRNGASKCFSGNGESELGCRLYIDRADQVYTVHARSIFVAVSLTKEYCNNGFEVQFGELWKDYKWIPFQLSRLSFFPRIRRLQSHGRTVTETDIMLGQLNATETAYFEGTLVKITYSVCNRLTCLLLKFAGKKLWNPLEARKTTTQVPKLTVAMTTTTTASTTKPETTSSPIPRTAKTSASTITTTATATTKSSTSSTTAEKKTQMSKNPTSMQNERFSPQEEDGHKTTPYLIAIIVGVCALILLLILIVVRFCKKRRDNSDKQWKGSHGHGVAEEDLFFESLIMEKVKQK